MSFTYNVGLKINNMRAFKVGLSLQEFYLVAYREGEITATTKVHDIVE